MSPSGKNEESQGGNTWLRILLVTGVLLGCYMAYRGFSTKKLAEPVVETKREEPSGETKPETQETQDSEPKEEEESNPEADSDNPEEHNMDEVGGDSDEFQGSDVDVDVDDDGDDDIDDDDDNVANGE